MIRRGQPTLRPYDAVLPQGRARRTSLPPRPGIGATIVFASPAPDPDHFFPALEAAVEAFHEHAGFDWQPAQPAGEPRG